MKLNQRHLHALDIAINKVLEARDNSNKPEEYIMLTKNANRLRQLRIIFTEAFIHPEFDFRLMFGCGIDESCSLVKGIRTLTGHCED